MKLADALRRIGEIQQTYYRRCRGFGAMNRDRHRQHKALEQEHTRLRRPVCDLTLDTLIPMEAARSG